MVASAAELGMGTDGPDSCALGDPCCGAGELALHARTGETAHNHAAKNKPGAFTADFIIRAFPVPDGEKIKIPE
jgi:hypothetical protein